MKGRFKQPIWVIPVLAMVLALGAYAVFAGISQFSATPAEADIQEAGQGISGQIDTEKLTEPLKTPLQDATQVVTGASATINPRDPGRATRLEINFQVSGSGGLNPGTSQIVLTLEDDWQVPQTLDRNQISMNSTDTGTATTPPVPSDSVAPQSVTVDFVGVENDEPEITLTVPDMIEGSETGAIGAQGIPDGATITVVFQQSAGIRNSTESSSDNRGNNDTRSIQIETTSPDTTAQSVGVFVPVRVELGSDDGSRGDTLTVVALGVEGGKTATFWLDKDGDGTRDADERDLCNVVASGDDTAQCSLTVSNPPFIPGRLGTAVDSNLDLDTAVNATATTLSLDAFSATQFNAGQVIQVGSENMLVLSVDDTNDDLVVQRGFRSTAASHSIGDSVFTVPVNFINVRDGDGRVTTGNGVVPTQLPLDANGDPQVSVLNTAALNRQLFELEPTVRVSPTSANIGDTVTVSLFDYPTGNVSSIQINGLNVTTPSASIPSSGQVSFGFTVPGTATDGTRIPTGASRFEVFGPSGSAQDTTLTIGGARLTLSHQEVVANQDLTITGSGFSEGSGICVLNNGITLNNVALEIDEDDIDASSACSTNNPNNLQGILLTSGGTFTATVRVHDQNIGTNNVNVALLTEGSHELKVIDANGAEGTLNVTIPEREINVNPASARPRDIVTIVGRNFVGDNPDGVSTTVRVVYQCGTDSRTATADPDVSGNFRETLRIPTNCSIPSSNTITATINAPGDTGIVETVVHEIPEALVRVEPVRGSSGSRVAVSGEGFRTFETVEIIEFGGRGTLGGRTVNTDGSGDFSVDDLLVPGLDPGIHSVKVEVGTGSRRTTAATSFEVLAEGFGDAVTTDAQEAFGDVSSLERAWLFDNTDKEWRFFDTSDEFTDVNTLLEVPSGAPVWLKVTEDTDVELNNQPFNLTCVNPGTPEEDCWNLIVFP